MNVKNRIYQVVYAMKYGYPPVLPLSLTTTGYHGFPTFNVIGVLELEAERNGINVAIAQETKS